MDAADLYALPPEDFTAARDAAAAQAKADGDHPGAAAIKALRRPTLAAWLVNLLAREEGELLDSLLALGPQLAAAQAAGSGDLLRELGVQRRALVDTVTERAVALADRQVASAVRAEVSGTLEAALADTGSAAAVRSGRLVRALSYAGFGGVDLDGAVAVTAAPSPAAEAPGDRGRARGAAGGRAAAGASAQQVAAAEAAALAASGELDDAVRRCERLSGEAERAEQAARGARAQAGQAEAALAAAQRALRDAGIAAQEAERAAGQARRVAEQAEERRRTAAQLGAQAVERVRAAQLAAERSRAALDELRRGPVRRA